MTQLPPSPPPMSPVPVGYDTPGGPKKTNGMAIGSLIAGVLGCIPFISGLVAIILGVLGIKKAKDPNVGGKPLAIIGLILGILSILGWTLFFGSLAVGAGAVAKMSAPGREVAREWMVATTAGDIDKAASLSHPQFPRGEIETISGALQPMGAFKDMTSSNINLVNNQLNLEGTATFDAGTKTYKILVTDMGGGSWKLQHIEIE